MDEKDRSFNFKCTSLPAMSGFWPISGLNYSFALPTCIPWRSFSSVQINSNYVTTYPSVRCQRKPEVLASRIQHSLCGFHYSVQFVTILSCFGIGLSLTDKGMGCNYTLSRLKCAFKPTICSHFECHCFYGICSHFHNSVAWSVHMTYPWHLRQLIHTHGTVKLFLFMPDVYS